MVSFGDSKHETAKRAQSLLNALPLNSKTFFCYSANFLRKYDLEKLITNEQ